MRTHTTLDAITGILLIIGGLNWGFISWFELDPIDAVFGGNVDIARGIFIAIGLSACYKVYSWIVHKVS